MLMLGPVSSASPDTPGSPFILFGSAMLAYLWGRYLRGDRDPKVTMFNMIVVSLAMLFMVAVGIWQLIRNGW